MKLSELIAILEKCERQVGDAPVKVFSGGTAWTATPEVRVMEGGYSNDAPFVVIGEGVNAVK